MSAVGLLRPLLAVAASLLLVAAAGWLVAAALLPRGRAFRIERCGWGFAAGLATVGSAVAGAFGAGISSVRAVVLAALGLAALLASRFRPPVVDELRAEEPQGRGLAAPLFLGLAVIGVGLYALRALTEPMWSNDFLAVWGLKAKAMFGAGRIPGALFERPSFAFSHPEYPVGLPLVYAGIAFLTGRWDDHALGLLFPLWMIATLLVLFGWLRRRGVSRAVAFAAVALLAHFEPLYSAFLTGMAEVPMAFALLLLGTALSDALDGTDGGSWRRLSLASFVALSTKNEGLFAVGAALLLLLWRGRFRTPRALAIPAAALAAPAALSVLLHRLALGSHPLRDIDFGYLARPGFLGRVGEAFGAIVALYGRPAWPAWLALATLLVLGRRDEAGGNLLLLAGAAFAAYAVLPAFCVMGPTWLVTWTFGRVASALAPLVLCGAALRLSPLFAAGASANRAGAAA